MRPALRTLLDNAELHLTLVEAGRPGALDRDIDWVHGSDLLDPTPFLADGQVVLTTGTQFADASPRDVADYVHRLARRGVRGVGFGTEVIRAGTPAELVEACRTEALPLFEVPYRTPFIAVVRAVADLLDRAAHERDDWARQAQRALSLAALRARPVDAVLAELQHQLGHPVYLVGAEDAAAAGPVSGPVAGPSPVIRAEAARLLDRGQRASSSLTAGPEPGAAEGSAERVTERVTLQTIGRSAELLGVLAVTSPTTHPLDRAAQSVITGVVALLGLALEHDRARARDGVAVRAALLDEALRGSPQAAAQIGRDTGNPFPSEPLVLARVRQAASETEALLRDSATAHDADDLVFAARAADGVTLCGSSTRIAALAERARSRGAAVGLSRPFPLGAIAAAADQAQTACLRARGGQALGFDDLAHGGLRSAIDAERMRAVAHLLVGPLRDHDRRFQTGLVDASLVWLEHNGQWERAAAALGMHRHTLKARIRQVEQLTGASLDTFAARAELWLALTAVDTGADD